MVTIYEPLYREGQQLTEPAFHALRVENSHPAWREFRILVDFYRQGKHKRNGLTGIFSPKFGLKTQVTAGQFIAFANDNSTTDVCLINPFPQIRYYSHNVWMQGEINHPGLTERAGDLLHAAGIDWNLHDVPRHDENVLCYSNFWVGSESFWNEYVGGVLNPIAMFLETSPDHPAARSVMGDTWHTDSAPFLPFIVERLFSTFLSLRSHLKISAYPVDDPLPYCLTDYEKELVAGLKPIVDSEGSQSPELRAFQALCCRLLIRYSREHFAANAHPHSGKTA